AELAALGINQDYAPVADVNLDPANPVIGIRSPGADPHAVAELTAAQVDGLRLADTVSTAKHFPGHGDTSTDSHTGLPVIGHSRAEWEQVDAPPFAAAIGQGVDSVMTAHIVVPALDPSGDPATLSRPVITGLLRGRLHYDGVVVTDSLGMTGVRARYGDAKVPVLALRAGADQLLDPPDLPLAYRSVLRAVQDGELTEGRIDASVTRVLRMKLRHRLLERTPPRPQDVRRLLGTPAHLAAADAVADRSVTLLRDDTRTLPLPAATGRRLLVTGWEPGGTGPTGIGTADGRPVRELARALTALGRQATPLPTGPAPDGAAVAAAVAAARAGDGPVVVLTGGADRDPAQRRLVAALLATGRPVVQIAVCGPYDLARLPGVHTALAGYSWSAATMRAAARVLSGRTTATGRLPVAVPGLFPLGFRLTCYYYRKAYYRAFWASPPACAVAEPHSSYSGETRFPLILQNIHRYFFYLAIPVASILTYDVALGFRNPAGEWGHMGLGTLVLLVNVLLIWAYTLSCHSCRHLVGGRLRHFSRHPVRYRAWQWVSRLNARHMLLAWMSLASVGIADLYVYLLASGAFSDPRFF
ncbi:glycoside hydrolase family 3 protein, partial [Streptacidiphilus griseoplanus]|uniref:glycoside hydrolase family 3 protein n=1 Tax=Peterkaempfera griseoplana TaxID=66896 RepID=UPI0006E230F8